MVWLLALGVIVLAVYHRGFRKLVLLAGALTAAFFIYGAFIQGH